MNGRCGMGVVALDLTSDESETSHSPASLLLCALVAIPCLDTRCLPLLAERLIGDGIETPAVMELAIMGTEPFDPRDARQVAAQAVAELAFPPMEMEQVSRVFLCVLAYAVLDAKMPEREATKLAWSVYVASDYSIKEPLSELGYLDDTWDAGWAGTNEMITERVDALLAGSRGALPDIGSLGAEILGMAMPFRH